MRIEDQILKRLTQRFCANHYKPDEVERLLDLVFDQHWATIRLRMILTAFFSQATSTTELGSSIESLLEDLEQWEINEAKTHSNKGNKFD